MNDVYAVILAGGSGTRFWPFSRETCPKQMLQIVGEDTLIRQTIKRINGYVSEKNVLIVTTEDKAEDLRFHIGSLGPSAKEIQFLSEPFGRNTAPAIGLAAIHLNQISPNSVMVVMPSDHAIPDIEEFRSNLQTAIEGVREDYLVTFGIKPTHPETGYGYIKVNNSDNAGVEGLFKVEQFVEKPDLQTAKTYVANGCYYWNSGIFVWKTSKILSEIQKYLPALYASLEEIEQILLKLDPDESSSVNQANAINSTNPKNPKNSIDSIYSRLDSISIDYGVMERSKDVLMVPSTFRWSDLGSWTALDGILERDQGGNILRGNTIDIGSQDSIVFAGERVVATIGLKNVVVADTPDATLIAPKERIQEVRQVVDVLKKNGREEHLLHRTVERPWGKYTVLEKGPGYKIKRIAVKPGARLSLQRHRRRSEHWVVVSGAAKVTRENEVYLVNTNESTYIPISYKHRLENPGSEVLQIIEVQNGDYVEEDDIERFIDDYDRTS